MDVVDKLLQWANIAYIVSVAIAAVTTAAIFHLSARVNAAKDRELETYRTESTIKITVAQAAAAEAMQIAESERLARAELESPDRCRRGPCRGGECSPLTGTARACEV